MEIINRIRSFIKVINAFIPSTKDFGFCGKSVFIDYPLVVDNPKSVYIHNYVYLRDGVRILNAPNEKVVIKDYCVISSNVTIAPNSHVSTVGIPQIVLGSSHVNDKSSDMTIEEDCWIGTGAIILSGANLGRGCVVGAGAIVTKTVPPYAVVAGCPAKIVAVKFDEEMIIAHEKKLYRQDDRYSDVFLDQLFSENYTNLKVLGKSGYLSFEQLQKVNAAKVKIGLDI